MPHDDAVRSWKHGMADIEPGLRMHYVGAGTGERVVVLLHGFPQTWWQWHHVIPPLVEAGFRVIAPDNRGAGDSWRPVGGYDKRTMARDVQRLVRQHLGVEGPIALVGHDVGMMIAYAYAETFRDEVSHLVVIDAPLPGTDIFDGYRADPRLWHFGFHSAGDVAEMLVAGRERQYLQVLFNARIFNPAAITPEDFESYVAAYSAPGAMRAGFALYRAFDQDAQDNRDALARNGKLRVPVLALGGATSIPGPIIEATMREVAENVTARRVPETGHWVVEENPADVTRSLLEFLGPA